MAILDNRLCAIVSKWSCLLSGLNEVEAPFDRCFFSSFGLMWCGAGICRNCLIPQSVLKSSRAKSEHVAA